MFKIGDRVIIKPASGWYQYKGLIGLVSDLDYPHDCPVGVDWGYVTMYHEEDELIQFTVEIYLTLCTN